MAITLHEQPNTYSLADGKVFFKLSSNNQFSNSGQARVFELFFNSIPSNGDPMEFSWASGDVSMPFSFNTVPDSSGLQLPIGGANVQAFVDGFLVPALQANAALQADWIIEGSTNAARLTARKKGAYYNTTVVNFAADIFIVPVAGGIDVVERPNFTLNSLVEINHNGVQSRYTLQAYPYGNDVYVHLNKLLTGFYNRLARPAHTLPSIAEASACVINYAVRFAEAFGEPAVAQKLGTTFTKYALPGGAGKDFKTLGDVNNYISNKRFLTSRRSMRLTAQAPQVLFYWHVSAETYFNVRFEATKTDGSTVSATPIIKTGVNQHSIWYIDVSPATVATALSIAVTDIASYNVVVIDITGPGQYYSEFYNIALDHGTPRDRMDVLYQNSFGVYEFMELRGFISKSTKNNISAAAILLDNAAADEPYNHVLSSSSQDKWTVATGFLSRTEVEAVKELLRSRDVYMRTATHYQPVLVDADSFDLYDTDSGSLNGLELTFTQEINEPFA